MRSYKKSLGNNRLAPKKLGQGKGQSKRSMSRRRRGKGKSYSGTRVSLVNFLDDQSGISAHLLSERMDTSDQPVPHPACSSEVTGYMNDEEMEYRVDLCDDHQNRCLEDQDRRLSRQEHLGGWPESDSDESLDLQERCPGASFRGGAGGPSGKKMREEALLAGLARLLHDFDGGQEPVKEKQEDEGDELLKQLKALVSRAERKGSGDLLMELKKLVGPPVHPTDATRPRTPPRREPQQVQTRPAVHKRVYTAKEGRVGQTSRTEDNPRLRRADWPEADACIYDVDELMERIDEKTQGRLVLLLKDNPEDFDMDNLAAALRGSPGIALTTVQLGNAASRAALLEGRPPENNQVLAAKIPLDYGGRLVLKNAAIVRYGKLAVNMQPRQKIVKSEKDPQKERNDTVCLRCTAYVDEVTSWKAITLNPGKELRKWCVAADPASKQALLDIWGWEELEGSKFQGKFVKGLARVKVSSAEAVLAASGAKRAGARWYVEPVRYRTPLGDRWSQKPVVDWVERGAEEKPMDYTARVLSQAVGLGITRGVRQLGVRRMQADSDKEKRRSAVREFRISGIPPFWDYEGFDSLLLRAGFEQISLMQKSRWRGLASWTFTAKRPDLKDMVELEKEEQIFSVVVTRRQRKFQQQVGRRLPGERSMKFIGEDYEESKGDKQGAPEPERDLRRKTPGQHVNRNGMDQEKETPTAYGADSAPKKCRTSPWPPGLEKIPNQGEGDCLFHAVAQALSEREGKKRVHTQVRAARVAQLQRQSEKFERHWDHRSPSETEAPMASWKEYLDAVSKRGAWGGYLELDAMASTLGARISVCHSSGEKHDFNRTSSG